jgi:hypothetical protein
MVEASHFIRLGLDYARDGDATCGGGLKAGLEARRHRTHQGCSYHARI